MFRIEFTRRALDQAEEAFDYLAANVSLDFAEEWYRGLFEQIETLKQHPRRCPVAAESGKTGAEVRELIYGKQRHKNKYRILFKIRDDLISILSVLHSARRAFDLEDPQ